MTSSDLGRRGWLRATLGVAAAGFLGVDALGLARARAGDVRVWQLGGLWDADDGRRVTLAEWAGRRAVLTMGYGACRKTCSTTMRRLRDLQAQADARGLDLEVIVIGLDPVGDTPAAWRQYREDQGLRRANWHFLDGSPALTRRMAQVLQLRYWTYDDHILHDYRVAAVAPDGRIVGRVEDVSESLGPLVEALAGA